MKKKFRVIAGKKFYCDEKGLLLQDAQKNFEEVAEDDTEATEVETSDEGVEEVEKMLKAARAQVIAGAEKSLGDSQVKAVEAIDAMLKAVAKAAGKFAHVDGGERKASFDVAKVEAGIADLAQNQRNTFSFEIKDISELRFLTKATSEGVSLTGDVIVPELQPEMTRPAARRVFMEAICKLVPNMTSNALSYVEAVTVTGAPAATAELAAAGEQDFTFQEYKAPLKKIMITNKHSVEILKDAAQLVAAIKGWLQEDVNIEVDRQILNGSGAGANLLGILGIASVLNAASLGTKRVANANLYDVIRCAITKISVSGKGQYQPTHVILNPDDADKLDLTKDTTGNYILPPFRSADGTTIKGVVVIENVAMTAGSFLVGDFNRYVVGTQGGAEIEMTNSDGTDFGKDILTVKVRRRIASYVRINDNGAFWTGSISGCIAALIAV